MLRDALDARPGVAVRTFSWRGALLGRYDVAHLHWPEILARGSTPARALARQLLLLGLLLRWRLTRTAVVRTRHNIGTHEAASGWSRLLLSLVERSTVADVVLNELTPAIPGRVRRLIPHGDYRPWYSQVAPAPPVPGRLAFVGLIRPYKGVEELMTSFAALELPGASLSVSGRADDAALAETVRSLAAADARVRLQLSYLSDEDLVHDITSAEVVVLPYREMHNSGGALAALSLERPVLVPDNDVTRALADEIGRDWVLTYHGELSPADLRNALEVAASRPDGRRPDLSHRSWERSGEQHEEVYREALRRVRS
jgi:glycosyltransferase involved in cell wall biosynthesis